MLAFRDASRVFTGRGGLYPSLNMGKSNPVLDTRRFKRDREFGRRSEVRDQPVSAGWRRPRRLLHTATRLGRVSHRRFLPKSANATAQRAACTNYNAIFAFHSHHLQAQFWYKNQSVNGGLSFAPRWVPARI
jgi:hypothetical protein